jgi:hypothetical protein
MWSVHFKGIEKSLYIWKSFGNGQSFRDLYLTLASFAVNEIAMSHEAFEMDYSCDVVVRVPYRAVECGPHTVSSFQTQVTKYPS